MTRLGCEIAATAVALIAWGAVGGARSPQRAGAQPSVSQVKTDLANQAGAGNFDFEAAQKALTDAGLNNDQITAELQKLAKINKGAQQDQNASGTADWNLGQLYRGVTYQGSLSLAVPGACIVHFATHALIDEEHPERSALALSPRPPAEDGILQVREIYRLRLGADLVTLSACETALGRDVAGEGIIGFARAFYAAGARAVVASLWDVDDAATADFMASFYERIGRGEPIDEALAGAKRQAIAGGARTGDPYYWAAFVVSGNAAAAIPPPQPDPALTRRASAVVGAVVLLCAAWVAAARRAG